MFKICLDFLLALHMSLEDNIKWLGEVMAEIGPTQTQRIDEWDTFNVKQANAIVDYLKIRYEFLS